MPYKDKAKQREAQRLWAAKQSSEFKMRKYARERTHKVAMIDRLNHFKYKKGSCEICDTEYPPCCFDFHHINGKEDKKNQVSLLAAKGYKWDTIEKELSKCMMLCAPCHRKIHAGLLEIIPTKEERHE